MIRSLLSRAAGIPGVRAWTRQQLGKVAERQSSADKAVAALTGRVEKLAARMLEEHQRVSDLAGRLKTASDTAAQVPALAGRLARMERVIEATDRMAPLLASPPKIVRDLPAVTAHVRAAVANTPLCVDPAPHVVIDNLLPRAFYDYLMAMLPPAECFRFHDEHKQDFYFDEPGIVPPVARVAWQAFERDVVNDIVMPALLERFAPVLHGHYARLFGNDLASDAMSLPTSANGRVLLRRPGYRQDPHLDPKRVLLTGLFYLAKPKDPEEYGTALYSVDGPFEQPFLRTFYPHTEGRRCILAKRVEFRANRLFAFLNGPAAHGAELPADAPLSERYAYQFYVKPGGLAKIVQRLSPPQRELWSGLPGLQT
jgi:hypothetical protein